MLDPAQRMEQFFLVHIRAIITLTMIALMEALHSPQRSADAGTGEESFTLVV
jgi:hypothetical protein